MKTWLSPLALVITLSVAPVRAEVPLQTEPAPPPQTSPPAPQLPYGVDDVVKLTRAQVSEEIVLNYVKNSGTVYGLKPNEIVYLRDQGVSDRVLNAMLEQPKAAAEPSPVQMAQAAQPTPAPQPAQVAPLYQSTPVYVQPAPPPVPAPSTVHVIPYPPVRYTYYNATPYCSTPVYYSHPYYGYRGYYRYGGPVVSFGLSFGGHRYQPHCW